MIDVKIKSTIEVEKALDSEPEALVPEIKKIKLNSGILIKAQHVLNGPEGLNIMLLDGSVLLNVPPGNVEYQEVPAQRKSAKNRRKRVGKRSGGCGCGKKKQ